MIILTLLKSLNCAKNAIYIIMTLMIIKSMIIKLIHRLTISLTIIIINEKINEKTIIAITKIKKT